jgi:hypothetical protein
LSVYRLPVGDHLISSTSLLSAVTRLFCWDMRHCLQWHFAIHQKHPAQSLRIYDVGNSWLYR